MTILIQSRPSNGAAFLRHVINEAGVRCLRRSHDATSRVRASSFLVNWGCSNSTGRENLNPYGSVCSAVNKLDAFQIMDDAAVSVPAFSPRYGPDVLEETNSTNSIWLARHSLTGSGGEGITVVRRGDVWPVAPLYVKYIPKLVEFRVHVFNDGESFRILNRQKLRESEVEQSRDERLIRNRENGWVFGLVRDMDGATKAQDEAIKAVAALGLDFGAVDVIVGRDDGKAYVLEVNTAPGLEADETLKFYRDAIINRYNLWRNHNEMDQR